MPATPARPDVILYYPIGYVDKREPYRESDGRIETYSNSITVCWDHNSGIYSENPIGGTYATPNPFNANRQFIALEKSFLKQLEQDPDFIQGANPYVLREKMKLSANAILAYAPDKISLQLTEESIFYTLIKDDITLYLQHCLVDELDGRDEALISIQRNNINLFNYGGSLPEAIVHIKNFLIPQYNPVPEFA